MNRILQLLSIMLLFGFPAANAELLILKQTDAGFVPLDDSDKQNIPTIEKILLRYQWPTSTAFALDPITERRRVVAETGDLFTPGKPNAEEIWIEQKIQQETGNNTYRVIFFPTTLYELFLICDILAALKAGKRSVLTDARAEMLTQRNNKIMLEPILESKKSTDEIRHNIKITYNNMNLKIIKSDSSLLAYMNSSILTFLFRNYPLIASSATSLDCSTMIKNKAKEILLDLITRLRQDNLYRTISLHIYFREGIDEEDKLHIIARVIDLEYEARELNKALLLRGTEFQPIFDDNSKNKVIAGSTIKSPFEKAYNQNTLEPYSVSFGNSLFGGIFNDSSACVYNYLVKYKMGYGLLINKKDYINNQCSNLFFITPLTTSISLFAEGEYFHSRTKTAVSKKDSKFFYIEGVHQAHINDKAEVILITRDPLEHASLFSKFLAHNGRIIQASASNGLPEQEQQFAQQIMQTQEEAAGYYKGIKGAVKWKDKVLPRARERIKQKKTSQESTDLQSQDSNVE